MWVSERFPTIDLLLAFLNDRRIRADRCKIVAVTEPGGTRLFHLLHQPDDDPMLELAAVAQAEADPLAGGDIDDAVDAAEAIIAGAQRDE